MTDLTTRQQQVYDFIAAYSSTHNCPPTLQEIARHLQVSGNLGVMRHLAALEKKGYIRRSAGRSRGISLVRSGRMVSLPVVGEVRAGEPRLAIEEVEDFLAVDVSLVKARNSFILRIRGDSMIDAHILDGDMAIVQPQAVAETRDIVVVMLNGEATLKRFFQESGQIRLQPENTGMEPILVGPDEELRILGKVTGIFRPLDD